MFSITVRRLLLVTIALIVYGCLYPWHFESAARPPLDVLLTSWPSHWSIWDLRDAAVNLLLYLPFGAAALWSMPPLLPRWARIAPVLLAAVVLSATLELIQVYVPGRVSSLFDVLCNLLGASAGVALALLYNPSRRRAGRTAIPAGPLFLVALYAGYQLYPFFPAISRTYLRHSIARLLSAEAFSFPEVFCCAAEWLAALWLLRAVLAGAKPSPLSRVPPALALLCLPVRLLIVARTEPLHEFLGALVALAAWAFLRDSLRLRAAVWLLALAILIRELAPFHFSATPSPFTWIPFLPTFEYDRQSALVVLFRKAFDYGAMVWLLAALGVSYLRAGLAVAAALALLEAVQRYLPGRTPETTDSVLVLLLTLTLWSLHNFERRRGLGYG